MVEYGKERDEFRENSPLDMRDRRTGVKETTEEAKEGIFQTCLGVRIPCVALDFIFAS